MSYFQTNYTDYSAEPGEGGDTISWAQAFSGVGESFASNDYVALLEDDQQGYQAYMTDDISIVDKQVDLALLLESPGPQAYLAEETSSTPPEESPSGYANYGGYTLESTSTPTPTGKRDQS